MLAYSDKLAHYLLLISHIDETYADNGGMCHLNKSAPLGGILRNSDSVVLVRLATASLPVVFRLELAGEERRANGVDAAGGRGARLHPDGDPDFGRSGEGVLHC